MFASVWRTQAVTATLGLILVTTRRPMGRMLTASALGLPLVLCAGKNDDAAEKIKRQAEEVAKAGNNVVLEQISEQLNRLIETGVPGQLSWGFVSGFSAGYCIKKVSKVAAFALGGMFIFVQYLSYSGYISVDYAKLEQEMSHYLDLNHDGKIDQEDAKIAYQQLLKVLTFNLPAGGGFTTGLVMGLRTA